MKDIIEKMNDEFDELYSQCEDGDDKLLCTHESHKAELKHFFREKTKELLTYERDRIKSFSPASNCGHRDDFDRGWDAAMSKAISLLDSTIKRIDEKK